MRINHYSEKSNTKKSLNSEDEYDYLYKIVVVGDRGAGKSCMILRFVDETYNDPISTVDRGPKIHNITIDEKVFKMQVWEAQPNRHSTFLFDSMLTSSARGLIITFDLTNEDSFLNAKEHIKDCRGSFPKDIPILLVGTKEDLEEQRVVKESQILELAEMQKCTYILTSAKNNTNIEEAFEKIARAIYQKTQNKKPEELPQGNFRSKLQTILSDKIWHTLTSTFARKPEGFTEILNLEKDNPKLSDEALLTEIKKIAEKHSGEMTTGLFSKPRNPTLRSVYHGIIAAKWPAEAIAKIENIHTALVQEAKVAKRFN